MGSISNDTARGYKAAVKEKYDQERFRRYRADGSAQFVDATRSEKFKHFAADPWYDPSLPPRGRQHIPPAAAADEEHAKFLIIGSGFGALLFAARLIDSGGVDAGDITLVDASNGYGGAWYWNRYPGLMCDIESSIYMPLLEEMGYIPKHRYSYGAELREHAENIARRFGLEPQTLFRSTVKSAEWDENKAEWATSVSRMRHDGPDETITLRSDFVILTAGMLVHPKLPLIPGLEDFTGHTFHTSRWDYSYTGGSQEHPHLINLKDKKVAIIGTGATAIQAVPELAKWAGQLYVFQRTASSVDVRGQRPIDPGQFRDTCGGQGWQKQRRENFTAFVTNETEKPEVDLVADGWTGMPSFSGVIGYPAIKSVPVEKTDTYIEHLHSIDLPRQERLRARVDEIILDRDTAEGLKPWYPGWCKRPCFHDEYLPAFNRPNVQLVDTKGQGVDSLNEKGLVFDGRQYDADIIIFSTGFEPWGAASPAHRAGMSITGRDGLSMDDKWANDVGTFQGLFTRHFPNLILPGGTQAAPSANQVHMMDVYATHVAGIVKKARDRIGEGAKVIIEPTAEGEADWVRKIVSTAHGLASLINCTPSYLTNETRIVAAKTPEEEFAAARRAAYTPGLLDYCQEIEAWNRQGKMTGLNIQPGPPVS